jgi:hypothetical protein
MENRKKCQQARKRNANTAIGDQREHQRKEVEVLSVQLKPEDRFCTK